MDFKFNFKGKIRKVKKKEINSFNDLQILTKTLFKNKLTGKAEYSYLDSDDDEITITDDNDIETMKEDMGDQKAIKIKVTLKIEKILNEQKKKKSNTFIVDPNTGEKIDFESSCSKSRSISHRHFGAGGVNWKRRVFEKKLIKLRAKKQKEKIKLEYSKKLKELEKFKKRQLKKIKRKEESLLEAAENGKIENKIGNYDENEDGLKLDGDLRIGNSFFEDVQKAIRENAEKQRDGVQGILKVKDNKQKDVEWKKLGNIEEKRKKILERKDSQEF